MIASLSTELPGKYRTELGAYADMLLGGRYIKLGITPRQSGV